MNTSTVATSSPITIVPPHLPPPEWSHARSQTEPFIAGPPARSQTSRPAVDDGLPPQPGWERDNNPTPAPVAPLTPLKKIKRSTTLTSVSSQKSHARKYSPLPKSPSVPTFHAKPDPREFKSVLPLPAPESLPATPGTPLLRVPSNASTADSRSPSQRRAPASHSSYGVETSNGPPPSFTTQRTLSQDRLWKPSASEILNVPQLLPGGPCCEEPESHLPNMDDVTEDAELCLGQESLDTTSVPRKSVDHSLEAHPGDPGNDALAQSRETLCISGEQLAAPLDTSSAEEGSKKSDDRKSEDLFLNIAQTDAGGQVSMARSERRKSRSAASCVPSVSRLSIDRRDEATPSPPAERGQVSDDTLSPRTEVPSQRHKRNSFSLRSATASAHPLEDLGRPRHCSGGTKTLTTGTQSTMGRADRETSPEPPTNGGYRAANLDAGTRTYRRSNLSVFRTDRQAPMTETQERPRYVDHNPTRVEGTDSTMSTTAPSTVWDELDELKSRIRKLELTGKLPSSSAAAMSTAERPQTATTTVTTMSSSPNQGNVGTAAFESAIDGVSASVHPLLHEAIRKAQPVLSADVYQKLEATASDALQLASMMGAGQQPGNAPAPSSSAAERQLRRRADSMCRDLTELTIALSTGPRSPPLSQSLRPTSRDATSTLGQTPPTTSYSADSASRFGSRLGNDTEDVRPSVTSRIQSRLESRRVSLLHNSITSSPQEHVSPEVAVHTPSSAHSQSQVQATSFGRVDRAPTHLRGRRTRGPVDGTDGSENDSSPSARPVSRARTDVSLRHRSARDRTSLGREYTSSHPLPSSVRRGDDTTTQGSTGALAASGLPARRAFTSSKANSGSSNLSSPATPRDNIQPGSRRYVSNGMARQSSAYLSSNEHTPEHLTVHGSSASGSRRSFGLSSRLGQVGNFVNGRLKAAKAERERQEALQEQEQEQQQQRRLVLRVNAEQAADDRETEAMYR